MTRAAGADENDNVEQARWGTPRQFDFNVLDHVELGARNGWLDGETAAKLSGSRFTVLRGRSRACTAPWPSSWSTCTPASTVTRKPTYRCWSMLTAARHQLPKFEDDLFKTAVGDSTRYLIPTSEVPLTNIVRDEIVDAERLPLRMTAHSMCFRAEAGSGGRDVRGMIRQHQFEKVELVSISRPEDSDAEHQRMTRCAEVVLEKLGLPYRKVLLCTGDMGFSAVKTYDLEVWLPSQETYREISSCSNCGDFQARRMQARWRNPATGKPGAYPERLGRGGWPCDDRGDGELPERRRQHHRARGPAPVHGRPGNHRLTAGALRRRPSVGSGATDPCRAEPMLGSPMTRSFSSGTHPGSPFSGTHHAQPLRMRSPRKICPGSIQLPRAVILRGIGVILRIATDHRRRHETGLLPFGLAQEPVFPALRAFITFAHHQRLATAQGDRVRKFAAVRSRHDVVHGPSLGASQKTAPHRGARGPGWGGIPARVQRPDEERGAPNVGTRYAATASAAS